MGAQPLDFDSRDLVNNEFSHEAPKTFDFDVHNQSSTLRDLGTFNGNSTSQFFNATSKTLKWGPSKNEELQSPSKMPQPPARIKFRQNWPAGYDDGELETEFLERVIQNDENWVLIN